jgi:hypothetical protein
MKKRKYGNGSKVIGTSKDAPIVLPEVEVRDTRNPRVHDFFQMLSTDGAYNENGIVRNALVDQWAAHGRPDIRQVTPENARMTYSSGGVRPNYSPISNDIQLPEYNDVPDQSIPFENYQAELAHAEQFRRQNLMDAAAGSVMSWLRSPYFTSGMYEKQYSTPGTIENVAHHDIQPAITSEFYSRIGIPRKFVPMQDTYSDGNYTYLQEFPPDFVWTVNNEKLKHTKVNPYQYGPGGKVEKPVDMFAPVGIPDRYRTIPDATAVQTQVPDLPEMETVQTFFGPKKIPVTLRRKEAQIKQAPEPHNILTKAVDIATNPVTAAETYSRLGYLPDNFKMDRNVLDYATDVINPIADINYAVEGVMDAPKDLVQSVKSGNYMPILGDIAGVAGGGLGLYNQSKAYRAYRGAVQDAAIASHLERLNVNPEAIQSGLTVTPRTKGFMNKAAKEAAVAEGNQWLRDYMSDPLAAGKQMKWTPFSTAYPSVEGLRAEQNLRKLLGGEDLIEASRRFDPTNPQHWKILGEYYGDPINQGFTYTNHPYTHLDNRSIASTTAHEGSHALDVGGEAFTIQAVEDLQKPFRLGIDKYLEQPTEIHARIRQLRKDYGIGPRQKVTTGDVDRMIHDGLNGNTTISPRWFSMIADKVDFKDLMNKAPVLGGVGLGVGAASTLQEGDEVNLSPSEIKRLKKLGYEFE